MLVGAIMIHNIEVGHVMIYELNKPFVDSDYELLQRLCKLISVELQKNDFYKKIKDWGSRPNMNEGEERGLPDFIVSLVPLILVFGAYTLFPAITGINVNIAIALGLGIVAALVLMGRNLPTKDGRGNTLGMGGSVVQTLNRGTEEYPGALLRVTTPAALAAVVTATTAFGMVIESLASFRAHYIVLTIVVVCIIVGMTSSPPAALMVALPVVLGVMLGQGYTTDEVLSSAPALARVSALAATTFETLPFNGLIVLTLKMTGTTHKESYKPMFIMSVGFTLLGTIVAGILLMLFPGLA